MFHSTLGPTGMHNCLQHLGSSPSLQHCVLYQWIHTTTKVTFAFLLCWSLNKLASIYKLLLLYWAVRYIIKHEWLARGHKTRIQGRDQESGSLSGPIQHNAFCSSTLNKNILIKWELRQRKLKDKHLPYVNHKWHWAVNPFIVSRHNSQTRKKGCCLLSLRAISRLNDTEVWNFLYCSYYSSYGGAMFFSTGPFLPCNINKHQLYYPCFHLPELYYLNPPECLGREKTPLSVFLYARKKEWLSDISLRY